MPFFPIERFGLMMYRYALPDASDSVISKTGPQIWNNMRQIVAAILPDY
jgi:hypothetical protein